MRSDPVDKELQLYLYHRHNIRAFLRAPGASERDRELLSDQAARRLVTGDYSGHGPSEAEMEAHGGHG